MVFDLELHEAHVGRVGELGDDAQGWKQSEGETKDVNLGEKKPKIPNSFGAAPT